MISIQNLTRRIVTFNVPELGSDAGVVSASVHDPVSGLRGVVDIVREHPRSITLLPLGSEGDTSIELLDSAAESTEIKNALHAQPALIKIIKSVRGTLSRVATTEEGS